MKIKQIVSAFVLASILSIGAFGQSVSGRITGLAVDPSDPSGNTVYISTAGGGVWTALTTAKLLGIG